jgi:crossover junction endodeoxyribonuclease RuvC
LASITNDDETVFLVNFPLIKVGKKKQYDVRGMADLLSWGRDIPKINEIVVGLEQVHAMPKQGVTSMWSMGRGTGIWEGILSALKLPYVMISPQRWKKVLLDGMPKDKGSSIVVAKRLFPEVDLPRKIDHNKADALLIAEYLRRTYRGIMEDGSRK